ncbi:MAG TPA: DUF5666 domain-containing protein [Thermoanaerobaculia bacterium]|nr:DUF5666 domain-containing protein [Thermoanaerobaculia bacterium]
MPTGPAGSATVMGTVILGAGASGATTQGMEIGLSGVTVRVVQGGQSTVTNSSGDFTLNGVPAGTVDLQFSRADINARAPVVLTSGTNQITAAVRGSTAVITPRGHAGEEIEGLVQANNSGGSLVVLDQRLGAVTAKADSSTLIRRGNTVIPLSQIQVGMRVHVKAMLQGDGTYLATEILLQDENVGGEREVEGTVASVDSGAKSFVVTTVSGPITVKTDSATTFKKKGSAASFSDVVMGAMVEAEGTLQADGSVLARKVTIE